MMLDTGSHWGNEINKIGSSVQVILQTVTYLCVSFSGILGRTLILTYKNFNHGKESHCHF